MYSFPFTQIPWSNNHRSIFNLDRMSRPSIMSYLWLLCKSSTYIFHVIISIASNLGRYYFYLTCIVYIEITSLGDPMNGIGQFLSQFLRMFTQYNRGARSGIQYSPKLIKLFLAKYTTHPPPHSTGI